MEMHNLEEELESGSEEERSGKRMKNARGQAKKARRTYPDQQLVDEVKRFMKEYSKLQKDVAQDIGASESVLSQYMHGVHRSNGWNVLEHKLTEWMEAVKAAEVPNTPLPASPNRKRKYSEIAGKFDGLDSPRESYYSDSDFSTSPNHDQIYVQPNSYQTPAITNQAGHYYQPQSQPSQPQQRPQQPQQPYNQAAAFNMQLQQQFWNTHPAGMRSSFSSASNPPAYTYYPHESNYYYEAVQQQQQQQQQQPVSHHSHWMPTEHNNFQQPITVTQNGQSVYYL
jgi:transcriptional regulator with XRE-family HTH domain